MTREGYLVHASKAVPEFIDISDVEFLKRFLEHIVPPGFRRIRHLGFLSLRNKAKSLEM
ncbi:MAG: transposase [Bacteroidales bacterium]